MGDTFGPNGFSSGSSTESQDRSILIVINRTHKPDVVVHFPDANGLAGEDRAEIDFFLPQTDAAAARDRMFIIRAPYPRVLIR